MGRHSILSIICYCIIIGGLSFTFTKGSPCGLRFTSYNGQITSPNYPSSYSSNLDCKWTIVRHTDQEIFLSIRDFTTESCCDRLIITDRNTGHQIAKLRGNCSVVGDGWFSTSSNNIELHFITDGSVINQGFHITFKSQSRYSVTVPDIPTTSFFCDGKTIPEVNATTTYGIIGDVTTQETTYGPRFTIGHSYNVRFEYETHGRVSIYDLHEICYTGVTYWTGEALCRSKGYSLNSYNSVYSRNYNNTYEIQCSSAYIYECYFRERGPCSNVLYINCFVLGSSTTETTQSYKKSWTSADYSIDAVDVRIDYGSYGRIFIDGQEVCSATFNYRYGEVLCRAKGYPYSTSFTSVTPRGPYRTVNISCYSDYLSSCNKEFLYNYCSSVVYLYCHEDTSTQPTTVTSEYVTIGYSSVYIGFGNGMQGKVYVNSLEVCADGVNNQTYEALCQTKGYHYHYYNSSFPNYPYQTLDMNCPDTNIDNCFVQYRNHYCSNALYLFCDVLGIRLIDTGYPWKGTIEILHNGQWGTICDDSFDKQDGDVICRMLGYSHSSQTYQSAHYGQGSGPIWLDDLGCHGYESDVAYCSSNGWGRHNCGHSEDAGVYCTNSTEYETTPYDPCSRHQCYNGGTCFVRNYGYPEYYCICPNGYTGSNCYYEATTFDPCYIYPCRHGGTCYRNYGYPGYYCACANGYTGQHCDTSVGFSAENSISVACTDNTWDISVYLPPLYNRYHDFNPSDIYLGTDSCTGYVNGNYLHFRSDYSACGTVTRTLSDLVAYTNQLVYALHDPNHHFIIHEYRFRVPVDCYLKRNEDGSGHFNHGHDVTIPSAHHVTGSTHHSVHLQFYTDSTFRYTKPLYGSRVGDRVYVKAYTDVRDYNLKMRISDCFTTPTSSAFSSMKYFIIQNGCVIDPNARILSQTTHETRFYFQDFEYSTNHYSLYLHCNATFCKSNDYSSSCEQACSHPRKRLGGGDIVHSGPVESMAVNKAVRLTKADDVGGSGRRGSSTVIAVLSVIFGTILIALVTFMVLGKIKRIRQKKTQVV